MDTPRRIQAVDHQGNMHDLPVSDLRWRPSAYGVIFNEARDHILLSPQWDGYDFPGGGVELGERLAEAMVREVREETGFEVEAGELIGVYESFYYPAYKPGIDHAYQALLFYYWATVTGGELSDAGFDEHEKTYAKQAEWVPVERLADLKFYISADVSAVLAAIKRQSALQE